MITGLGPGFAQRRAEGFGKALLLVRTEERTERNLPLALLQPKAVTRSL